MNERDERELADFASRIAAYDRPRASAKLRGDLRGALLGAPVSLVRRPSLWVRLGVLRPVLAAVIVLALLVGAGGTAAASSLPGDPAFALKRAAEETQLALTFDDASALNTLVALSDRRLAELTTAAATRTAAVTAATEEYLTMVARVDAAVVKASALPRTTARDAAIARASSAAASHIAQLVTLASRLPEAAQPGIQRAIDAQQRVHGKSGGSTPVPNESGAPSKPSAVPGGQTGSPGRGGQPTVLPRR